jgi:DNA-directed RNA polymerase specialized sigma24 family protein
VACARRLPAAPREILLLRHVEGLEMEEIAQIVGCTKISVPVRLFRARRQFKDLFLALLQEEGE